MSETVMNTETQNKAVKGKKALTTVVNTIINILIVVVLITSLLIAVMALTSKANGISTVFGYTVQSIQSDSMKGGSPDGYEGGDFGHGDLMIAKATDFDDLAVYDLGDIVTFKTRDSDNNEMLIVHRIVDVVKSEGGTYLYQTQGDNRETSPVPDQDNVDEYLRAWEIGSVFYSKDYHGTIIKGIGGALDYLKTQQGFFFVVLLPMILFFMYELIRVVINTMNYKKTKADEEKDEAVKAAVAEALSASRNDANGSLPGSLEEMTPDQLEQFRQFLKNKEEQKAVDTSSQAEDIQPGE